MAASTLDSDRYYYTFGPHGDSHRIQCGDSVTVICADSDNRLADGSVLPSDRRQVPTGSAFFEGNPVAKPLCVEDAKPGDCLAVDIIDVELDRDWGQTLLAPGHGLLSSDQLSFANESEQAEPVPRHLYQWQLDHYKGVARLENPLGSDGLEVPLDSMVGTIGVCPQWGQEISTLMAGAHGGNLDLPIIKPGATLLLPVFHQGALLSLGDIHAAQGHGEIVGGGIETSGKVKLRVRLLQSFPISVPHVFTDSHVFGVATAGDLRHAIEQAYSELVRFLANDLFDINRWDLFQQISQIGIVELGGIVVPSCSTVAAGVPLQCLPQRCQKTIDELKG